MIAIVNIGGNMEGVCKYELRVNQTVITTFKHNRKHGLAICLLAAAYAALGLDAQEVLTAYENPPKPKENG